MNIFNPKLKFSAVDLRHQMARGGLFHSSGKLLFKNYYPPMNAHMQVTAPRQVSTHMFAKAGASEVRSEYDLPVSFDWREQAPELILPAQDQGECGSCWVFSAANALTDRYALWRNQKITELDCLYALSCIASSSQYESGDCDVGGLPSEAGLFFERQGIPNNECWSYQNWCCKQMNKIPMSITQCLPPNQHKPFETFKAQPGSTKSLQTADDIKTDIWFNGPVVSTYRVFQDFMDEKTWMNNKNGIYVHDGNEDKELGRHAVCIIGWGYDEQYKLPYWIIRNSWGPAWGEQGCFKMAMFPYNQACLLDTVLLDKASGYLYGGAISFLPLFDPIVMEQPRKRLNVHINSPFSTTSFADSSSSSSECLSCTVPNSNTNTTTTTTTTTAVTAPKSTSLSPSSSLSSSSPSSSVLKIEWLIVIGMLAMIYFMIMLLQNQKMMFELIQKLMKQKE